MRAGKESQTAVLVCAGRAAAAGRTGVARFADPTAEVLLPQSMRERVAAYRAGGAAPRDRRENLRQIQLRAVEALMVPRTVAIDDAVREAGAGQLVILGAGLDGRAWRLPELAGAVVFEVDHPASQQAKRERSASLTPAAREIRFVPVDFGRDDVGVRLGEAGHDWRAPTTWVWEGVVPYLTGAQVRATLAVLARRSAPGSRLVVAYSAPSLGRYAGRLLSRVLASGGDGDMLAEEPQRSTYTVRRMRDLLGSYGFAVVSDRDVVEIGRSMGADVAAMGPFARANRIVVADQKG
jgi:methyltransferase (TIGR00027 family)